ncbi:MAG: 16S rRNA (adenine(1518)-N(6)/adenine(1519)-N(6))-dimethyltransferase RsmA [candidate division WOR-3 bacterium]
MLILKSVKFRGQSFLTHNRTADKLVEALELQSGDVVMEIGAGKGILTARLLQKAKLVIAIEIDKRLVEYLNEKFSQAENLRVISADFLQFDLKDYRKLKIIGNLPYYISTAIVWKLLDNYGYWDTAVLTTQREFARRVLAAAGSSDYCALSVLSEFLCERRRLFDIPASYFKPKPRIVSTAFRLKRRGKTLSAPDYEVLKTVVLAAFSPQPRKLVINNLTHSLKLSRTELIRILGSLDLPLNIRPASVNLNQFIKLSEKLAPFIK